MQDWIALDGIRSDALPGLVCMSYTPPLLAKRQQEETLLPGRLTAVTQKAWQYEPFDLSIQLALVGATHAEMLAAWQEQVLPWAWNAARLELDALPGRFFRGAVTEVGTPEITDRWMTFTLTFRCNPPLSLRLCAGLAGWFPATDIPIPQQLTAENATVSGNFTAAGWLQLPEGCGGAEAAETYLTITGTWTTLRLGASFSVLQAANTETTLYLDSENGQVWRCEADGTEVNMMGVTSGELPEIRPGQTGLQVNGEGLHITARLLVIERG